MPHGEWTHLVLEREESTAQPERNMLGISERIPLIGGRGPKRRSLRMSRDRMGQGHSIRRTAAPVTAMPIVQGLAMPIGPFMSRHPFSEFLIYCPWSCSEAGGMLGPAAGHGLRSGWCHVIRLTQASSTYTEIVFCRVIQTMAGSARRMPNMHCSLTGQPWPLRHSSQ